MLLLLLNLTNQTWKTLTFNLNLIKNSYIVFFNNIHISLPTWISTLPILLLSTSGSCEGSASCSAGLIEDPCWSISILLSSWCMFSCDASFGLLFNSDVSWFYCSFLVLIPTNFLNANKSRHTRDLFMHSSNMHQQTMLWKTLFCAHLAGKRGFLRVLTSRFSLVSFFLQRCFRRAC